MSQVPGISGSSSAFEWPRPVRRRLNRIWWSWSLTFGLVIFVLSLNAFFNRDLQYKDVRLLAQLGDHLFSQLTPFISIAQYMLFALAVVVAWRYGSFLLKLEQEAESRLGALERAFAAGEQPPADEISSTGAVAEIESRLLLAARTGGSVTSEALLEAFDTEVERHQAPLRYFASIAVFFGLIGTFWGIQSLVSGSATNGDPKQLFDQLTVGMRTAFASSIVGVVSALLLGLLFLRLYGLAAALRQELRLILDTHLLPRLASHDLSEPLVEVLAELRQAISGLSSVGDFARELPSLIREMQGLFGNLQEDRSLSAAALEGLTAAVGNVDDVNNALQTAATRIGEASQAMVGAATSLGAQVGLLVGAANGLERHTQTLHATSTEHAQRLQALLIQLENTIRVTLDGQGDLLAQDRQQIAALLNEAVQEWDRAMQQRVTTYLDELAKVTASDVNAGVARLGDAVKAEAARVEALLVSPPAGKLHELRLEVTAILTELTSKSKQDAARFRDLCDRLESMSDKRMGQRKRPPVVRRPTLSPGGSAGEPHAETDSTAPTRNKRFRGLMDLLFGKSRKAD